jgi:hypothetical protein
MSSGPMQWEREQERANQPDREGKDRRNDRAVSTVIRFLGKIVPLACQTSGPRAFIHHIKALASIVRCRPMSGRSPALAGAS